METITERPTARDLYPFFKEARRLIQENKEGYLAACKEWADEGFAPHYCIHGVNLWVDFDCACFRCEMDDRSDLQEAKDLAAQWHQEEFLKNSKAVA